MRRRFFLTIFLVLTITSISISAIHYHFYKGERLRLIELNLEQNASLLMNSDINLTKNEFTAHGERLFEEILGDDRVNMIIAIYNEGGNLLYQNDNALLFNTPPVLSSFQEWEDIEQKEYYIKYLTLRDVSHKKIVRVGMILNQSLLRWRDLNQRIFIYVGILLVMILFISFLLTYILFKPVHDLAEKVNYMAEKVEKGELRDLRSWFEILNKSSMPNDEFQNLVLALDRLAKKITETQQLTQRWSAMMAHELKTPMTILKNTVEHLIRETQTTTETTRAVELELEKLETIIMNFLEWASLENDTAKPELHVFSLNRRTEQIIKIFSSHHPQFFIDYQDQTTKEKKILCHPVHFEQVVNNLLTNAFKYAQGELHVTLTDGAIEFRDNGPGIPERVLENFGQPFNRISRKGQPGQGLGLAWVNTISKKYDWSISFEKTFGALIRIKIPDLEET